MAVEVALSEVGAFAAVSLPETRTVTIAAGDRTAALDVATVDDDVDEDDGKIVAQVQARDGVYAVGDPGEAEVVVRDDEAPAVTIAADASPIAEGETARFTVRLSSAAPTGGTAVEVALSEVGAFAAVSLPETRTVTIAAGDRTAALDVATVDDVVDEDDGKIVAQVQARTGVYAVADPGEAEVVVRDDEAPAVTIAADASPIAEGETARFTVRLSSAAPTGGTAVEVALSEVGAFAAVSLPETRTVTIAAGDRTAALDVATVDDDVDEDDGKIVAQVQARTGVYAVGDPGEAEVVVRDDEAPAVTIAADASPIAEGETARFTVRLSSAAPTGGTAVEVALSEVGAFAAVSLPETRTVTVGAGDRTAALERADRGRRGRRGRREDRGAGPGAGGRVRGGGPRRGRGGGARRRRGGGARRRAAVTIAADASPIAEGETARFTVSLSSAAPPGGLAVEVALSEVGEFAAASLPETRTVTVGAGARTAALDVPTVADDVDEVDGKIVAQVQARAGVYAVGDPGAAEVVVRDDDEVVVLDDEPAVTIAADASPIAEGETARFTVRLSSAAPPGGLAVEVALSEVGEFAAASLPETRTVTVGAGARTAAVSVPTVVDEVDEVDGKIVAQVQARAGVYAVGDPGAAEVVVRDDDEVVVSTTSRR